MKQFVRIITMTLTLSIAPNVFSQIQRECKNYEPLSQHAFVLYKEAKHIAQNSTSQEFADKAELLSKSTLIFYNYVRICLSRSCSRQIVINCYDRVRFDYNALVKISNGEFKALEKIFEDLSLYL